MMIEEEDEILANFLESEILAQRPDTDGDVARVVEGNTGEGGQEAVSRGRNAVKGDESYHTNKRRKLQNELFGRIPLELFHHILKFLSSEDLVSCSMVCRALNFAASDESLWRRLYCMRWGLLPPSKEFFQFAWKKLYILRDEEDLVKLVRNCPPEFKEYYTQMQASKRSQAPNPSQVLIDHQADDKTVAERVLVWKSRRGFHKDVEGHNCSGDSCSFIKIGEAFVCEISGNVHVCDYTCREVVMDPTSQLLVCTISGHCYDGPQTPAEGDSDADQQQDGAIDEAEPSNRLGQLYSFGYNCNDEEELDTWLWNCPRSKARKF